MKRWHPFRAMLLLIVLFAVGCDRKGQQEAANAAQSESNMRLMLINFSSYYIAYDKWPDTLQDAMKPIMKDDVMTMHFADAGQLLKNPLTGDDPGYEYVKPQEGVPFEITPPVVVLFQLRGGTRALDLPVGYSDGSVGAYRKSPESK